MVLLFSHSLIFISNSHLTAFNHILLCVPSLIEDTLILHDVDSKQIRNNDIHFLGGKEFAGRSGEQRISLPIKAGRETIVFEMKLL